MRCSWFATGLLAAALWAAPSVAQSKKSSVRRPTLALSHAELWPRSVGQTGPTPDQATQSDWQRALRRVRSVMAPLCEPRCGSVRLELDPNLDSAGRASPGRYATTLGIHPTKAKVYEGLFGSWGPLYVVAHEYGHHLDIVRALGGVQSGQKWRGELVADVLAGCALQRAGMRRAVLLRGLGLLRRSSFDTDADHPSGDATASALAAGFDHCARAPTTRLERLVRGTRDAWARTGPGPRQELLAPRPH